MYNDIDFLSGQITWCEEELQEDMLQVVYPNNTILDMGWYEGAKSFIIYIIKDYNWDAPVAKYMVADRKYLKNVLVQAIDRVNKVSGEGVVSITNEQRAEQLIKKYGFDFEHIPKQEIIDLIQQELVKFQQGSSEYIRLLCGYLYCIGDASDASLIEKAKYSINMDVGCMIDGEWIESLRNGGSRTEYTGSRQDIINSFVAYYKDFKADDE